MAVAIYYAIYIIDKKNCITVWLFLFFKYTYILQSELRNFSQSTTGTVTADEASRS